MVNENQTQQVVDLEATLLSGICNFFSRFQMSDNI